MKTLSFIGFVFLIIGWIFLILMWTTHSGQIYIGKECKLCTSGGNQYECDCQEKYKDDWNNPLRYSSTMFCSLAIICFFASVLSGGEK